MIVKKKKQTKIEIDLTGEQGNVFFLIGTASKLSKKLGLDGDCITQDMMSGDYEHAIDVFEENFGEFCIIYR